MVINRTKGNASLLKRALQITRQEGARLDRGLSGSWKLDLTISGIDEARRLELASAMAAKMGGEHQTRGDGLLGCSALLNGYSMAVACGAALGQFFAFLHDAGMTLDEIRDSEVSLHVEATDDEVVSNDAGKLQRYIGRFSHGLSLATLDVFDIAERQRQGDRQYMVVGAIENLQSSSAQAIMSAIRHLDGKINGEVVDTPSVLYGGQVPLDIEVIEVGTPLQALMITLRNLGDVLELVSPGSSLHLTAGV